MEKKIKSRVKPILTALLIAASFAFAVLGMIAATGADRRAVNAEPAAHSHDGYTEWTSTNSLPGQAGSYYLASDVTLSGTWYVPNGTVDLCLNGHGIKKSGNTVVYVGSGATLNVYDCGDTEHKFTVASPRENGSGAATVNDALTDGYKTFKGGYITGGNATYGAGINMSGGTVNWYGGNLIGNNSPKDGGAVLMNDSSTFTMYGGSIQYNYGDTGGAFFVEGGSTLTLEGGTIAYNTNGSRGAAIFTRGTVRIHGGEIVNNYNWGEQTIALWGGTFEMTGGVIKDNFHNASGVMTLSALSLGGNPVVKDNLDGSGNQANLYVKTGGIINIVEALADSVKEDKINLTFQDGKGQFTQGWATYMPADAEPTDYFNIDTDYDVLRIRGEGRLVKEPYTLISFDGGDESATGFMEKDILEDGATSFTLPTETTFKLAGKALAGWKLGNTVYAPGEIVTLGSDDVTFTAVWTDGVTVTFDSMGGNDFDPKCILPDTAVANPGTPKKAGYTFLYWTLDGKEYDFSAPVTEDITLKALWGQGIGIGEGFEDGAIPDGWTTSGDYRFGVATGSANGGSAHLGSKNALASTGSYDGESWLILPEMDLSSVVSVPISFWYLNPDWSGDTDVVGFYYRINGGEWLEIFSDGSAHGGWTEWSGELPQEALVSGVEIAFKAESNWGYGVGLDDIVIEAITPHTHDWTYTADGNIITATCAGMADGTCSYEAQTVTVTAEDKDYDGSPVEATVIKSANWDVYGLAEVGDIVYSGNTTAGEYTASITAGGVTAVANFTIVSANSHEHDDIAFKEWTETTSLPTEAGNYFLSADVTIASGTWNVPSGTTKLCLNGYGIIGNTGNAVITIGGATLYLYDCGETAHKYTVDANHLATVNDALEGVEGVDYFTFTGGYITGAKRTAQGSSGGGVYANTGTFYMNGGTIIGNSADMGGGVHATGVFVMNGGSIRNNNANTANGKGQRNGGGVYSNGTFTMNGGVITENWCANAGGAVLLQSTATSFIMNGGAIINNYNRGLSNNMSKKPVQIGAEAVLEGNVDNDGNPCDIWLLQAGNTITILGERTNTTPIGVLMGTPGVFTSGLSGNGTLAQFTSTNDNYFVDSGAGGEAQLSEKVASVTADEKETFYGDISSALNAWTDGSTLKLLKDVTARITVTDGDKTLDLNDHSITYTSGTVIIVSGGTLRITDQSAAKTTHYYTPNATGVATLSNTDTGYRFEGGFITGGVNNNNRGAGLSLSGTGSVVFDSGTIFANKAGWGGGIHTSGSGSLTIEGTAAIIGNYSSGNYTSGGGMFMEGSCAVTMTGGSIRHNSAQFSGGGVRDCIQESTGVRFTMTGGEITGNSSANDQGNGFCFDMATTFNIGGTARIIGNQGTNDLYFYNDRYLTVVAPFEEGAMIGVLLQGGTGAFTSGWSTYMDGKDPADYFTPSNADEEYIVYLTEGGEAAVKSNVLFEGEGTEASPYLIQTSDDWDALSEYIKNGKTFYNGKYFRLTDDITVTTTLGFRPGSSDNEDRVFSGFFDGDGHTLNVNINTNAFAAPFAIVYSTTIENLHVTGTVNSSGAHASGLVGATKASTLLGASTLTVRNVTVSVDVHGGSHTAGVIGHAHKASIVMENVTFDGSIYATSLQGGYVGWGGVSGGEKFSMTLKDCLFLGTYNTAVAFNPVAYASGQGMVTLTNDFLTMSLGSGGSPVATSGSGSVELIAASVASGETMTYYSDFNAAFTDWRKSSGGTLKLYKDVELTSSQDKFTAPYEWTLDLNGKTLTVKGDSFLTAGGDSTYTHGQGATINIDDTSENGGGAIDGNGHNTGGNLLYVQWGGTFNFIRGTIRNFLQSWGTLLIHPAGTVNMYEGFTFSGNRANSGGGGAIFADGDGVFNMYGGVIENNNGAGGKGGGILISGGSAVVNIYGGTIRNNTASNAGGGIAYTNGTLNISGEVTIEGNTVSGKANNVYVASGKTINITADFSATASIGVTLQNGTGAFTSGWATYFTEADPADYFFSENANYIIVTNADGEAAVGPREIDPSEVTETDYEGDYDGAAHSASVEGPDGSTVAYGTAEGTYTLDACPTYVNAGTYTVYYEITKPYYNPYYGSLTVTINKIDATVTVTGNTSTIDYDGTAHTVEGYDLEFSTELYTADDFTFSGTATATQTNAGTANMGLAASQFTNTNNNFATVTFNVTDGFQTVESISAVVTVIGDNATVDYDGLYHKVSGYTATADTDLYNVDEDFTFSGPGFATAKDVGTTVLGLKANMFANTNANFGTVTFVVTSGFITINAVDLVITVTGNSGTAVYDGTAYSVEGFEVTSDKPVFNVAKKIVFSGSATATRTEAGTAYMGLTADMFSYPDPNFSSVTFEIVDGYQTIVPAEVTVTVTGNNAVFDYDGAEHAVEGFTAVASSELFDVTKDLAFTGEATAVIKEVGTEYMGLTEESFVSANDNFNVTFVVEDGFVTVEPAPVTVITVTGNSATAVYDGEAHTVEGFTVVASTDLYDVEKDFVFSGEAAVTGTDVGTVNMGLTAEMFRNVNENFENVVFVIEDGYVTVEPASVTVTVTGNAATVLYDGKAHTAEGYEVEFDNALYTEEDFTFNGSATATLTDVGTANMGLTVEQFANNNENFIVTFEVVDGYVTVEPASVTVTVTGNAATVLYDGKAHTAEGYEVEFDNALYTEEDFTFDGSATATLTDAGTANMGLTVEQFANNNENFIVTFEVEDGYVTVDPIDVAVTVTGKNGTFDYDGKAHTAEGYEVEFDNSLYTAADFTFNGSASATQTNAGTANMGLAAAQFTNINANFANVTFIVVDGYITVNPIDVTVTVTGNNATFDYDGTAHTAEGYEVAFDNALYTEQDFTFNGSATATLTDAGTANMGLAAAQFTNINANFANVTFIVTDGFVTVEPVEVEFIKLPEVIELKYVGIAQQLISEGVVEGGTILYALGASGSAPADASFKATLPTATEIGTYYVWYKVEADENHKDFAPVCLTAEIKEDDSALKGIVFGSDGATPVDGATVTLVKGNETVETFVTAFDGRYRFQVPAGVYNLVVEYENVTVTLLVTVSQETVKDVTMPDGITESILEVEDEESFGVAVGGLDEEAYAIRRSENVPADKVVSVVMKVDAKVDEATESAVSIIEAAADQTLVFYEIKVEKTVDSVTTTLDETANVLEIAIPYNKTNKKGITVYSYHGAKVTTFTESDSRRSGTFRVDKENGYVYVYSNRFSTYAIGYTPYYRVNADVSLGSYSGTATVTLINNEDGQVYVREGVNVGKLSFTDIPAGEYTMTVTWTDGTENSITMPVSVKAKAEKISGSSDVEPALANENDLETEDKALLNSKKSEGSKGSRDDDESSKGAPEADAPKGSDDNSSKGEEDEDSKGGRKDGSKGRNEEEDPKGVKGGSKGKAEDEDEENESKETSKGKAEQATILSKRTRERRNE